MEATIQYIISQIFTIISYIFLGATYYAKNRKNVLILNCIEHCSYMMAYILLDAWSGLAMSMVALIRNILFIADEKKNGQGKKTSKADINILIITYMICILLAIITYEEFLSLLPVISTMLYTFAVCQKDIKVYKLLGIPIEILWVAYNIYIKSLFGIILETVMLCVCTIGYIREIKKK